MCDVWRQIAACGVTLVELDEPDADGIVDAIASELQKYPFDGTSFFEQRDDFCE